MAGTKKHGFAKTFGSKAEVFHGSCLKTTGGLTKKMLMKHKGRIISRKKHAAGKKAIAHLRALGYIAKKGTFKLMSKSMRKSSKRHGRKHGGGPLDNLGAAVDTLMGKPVAAPAGSAAPAVGSAAPAGSAAPKVGGRRRERRTRRKSRRGSC